MKPILNHRALLCALLATSGLASPALAQLSPYPLYRSLDENGVDLTRGDFLMTLKEGSIGSGNAELALIRTNGTNSVSQWDKYTFDRTVSGSNVTIKIGMPGGFYEEFKGTVSGSTFTVTKANGASLTGSDSNYVYTSAAGVKIRFVDLSNSWEIGQASNFCSSLTRTTSCMLAADRITQPNGGRVTLSWDVFQVNASFYDSRILSVSTKYGYSITFAYQTNSWVAPGGTWHIRSGADFRNTVISPNVQASVAYAYPSSGVLDLTDMAGNVWRITDSSIRRPGESSPYFTVTANGSGVVSSVAKDGVTTTYNLVTSGNTGTLTKTNPLSQATVIISDLALGQPTSIKDPLNRTTSISYDTSGRLTRVTQPEGNYVQYTLDGRGNATQTQFVAKAGSGLSPITTSAAYPATCTNVLTCNQPTSTTDARGKVTDYTYDATHGGVLTVTRPAPTTGAVRPQTRTTYTQFGTAPALFYLPTGASECQTLATCAGAADEVKATVGYDTNANPTSITRANGTGTLSATTGATYDAPGNLLTVDGPLTGIADTTRYRYDNGRRLVGAISPDPDGAGALKMRAVRNTFDVAGRTTKVEHGTVNSQSDPDWAAFASLEAIDIGYDANSRVATRKLSGGGSPYALTQLGYDAAGRPECSAQRMNVAAFGSLPTSACSLGTQGSFGPDRVAKAVYDAAGEVTQQQVAVGSADAATERTMTYSTNDQLQTLKDAENNLTTYEYDGLDRLAKTRMPDTTKGAGTSSTTDYEQLTYDAASNVTSRRLRDANSIALTYDNLNRPTLKDLPGTEPDVTFAYDNLGRLTSATQTGNALSFTYDALSRNLTQAGPQGTATSAWDLADRRTQLTYPGSGLFVNYDYLVTGETTAIRENGAVSGVGVLATYAYDSLGRRTSTAFGNGVVQAFTFDPVSRLASLSNDLTSTANDLSATFSYNPASQITSQVRTGDAYAWTGHFNQNATGTANGLNQLTAVGAKTLTHDTKGNVTGFGTKTFGYSSENLLLTGPSSTTLAYDPMTRLYQTVSGASTSRLAYDGLDRLAEYDGSNALQRRYVHGPGMDEPIVWYEGSGTTDRRFLSADERGSIIAVTDSAGAVLGLNKYDEYGQPQSTNLGAFGYTGQAWLPTVGVWYYKARMYDPELGTFYQADPIDVAGGINLYSYVGNDSVNWIDPLGLTCVAVGNHPCPADDPDITVIGQRRRPRYELFLDLGSWFGGIDRGGVPYSFGGGDGDSTSISSMPPKPLEKAPTVCDDVATQRGLVLVGSVNGSFIPGVGATGALGGFVNLRTGSFGGFSTLGGGYGVDFGFSVQGGFYASVANLRGVNVNVNIATGRATGTASFSTSGKLVGLMLGTGAEQPGAALTATNTKLIMCHMSGS